MCGWPEQAICPVWLFLLPVQSQGVAGDPPHLQAGTVSVGSGAQECRECVGPGSMVEPREEPGEEAVNQSNQVTKDWI